MGGGKIKMQEELTVTAFSTQHASRGMAAAGSYLPCRLREGRWHCRLDSNFIEKRSCEKKF